MHQLNYLHCTFYFNRGLKMATSNRATAAKKTPKSNTSANRRAQAKPSNKTGSKPKDAIAILRADHSLVSGLFAEYEKTRSVSKKKTLVSKICTELSVHAQVEEEIFYPAVKAALRDKELVPEATVEHATLKDLISQVEGIEPDGEMFDAKIKVMAEYVKHHVKEEQNEMFPKAKSTKLDMVDLGERILARKEELKPEMGLPRENPKVSGSMKEGAALTT
jgi:hemerythrin superfamily protein